MTPKLIVNNSYSQVLNLPLEVFKALREELSYKDDPTSAYFGGRAPRTYYLIDKSGNFPSGLLHRVEPYLHTVGTIDILDKRVKPHNGSHITLNSKVAARSEQLEAANAIHKYERGIISAVTGSGKSMIAALIVQRLGVKTLIVVPSLELKSQLTESFKAWFGRSNVGKGKLVYIENVQALDPKQPVKGYDCLIIDEFHHSAAATYRRLNKYAWNGIYYRVGLTATPFRNQDEERLLLESILSQVVYELDYKTAVYKRYICPVESFYFDLPKQKTTATTWPSVYSQLVVNNDHRNQVIANTLLALKAGKLSTLCLVKEIKHGEILSKLTGIPFANGQDEDSRQFIEEFKEGRILCLIGTTGVIGEGVDTKPCEYVVIAGLGKAKSAFMQQVGRAVRRHGSKETAKVILFRDKSHKFTLRHYEAQAKVLEEEYGSLPSKIDTGVG